jgi:hypothetical protein
MASVVIILKQKVLIQAPDRDTITELLRPLYSPSDSSFRLHETMTPQPHTDRLSPVQIHPAACARRWRWWGFGRDNLLLFSLSNFPGCVLTFTTYTLSLCFRYLSLLSTRLWTSVNFFLFYLYKIQCLSVYGYV